MYNSNEISVPHRHIITVAIVPCLHARHAFQNTEGRERYQSGRARLPQTTSPPCSIDSLSRSPSPLCLSSPQTAAEGFISWYCTQQSQMASLYNVAWTRLLKSVLSFSPLPKKSRGPLVRSRGSQTTKNPVCFVNTLNKPAPRPSRVLSGNQALDPNPRRLRFV